MEPDELSALKLDEEFKTNLAFIRPHLLSINSVNEARLLRLWLNKLSQCLTEDRVTRNAYLSELLHQVQQGRLQTPFNESPPVTLKKLQVIDNSSSWSDETEGSNCVHAYSLCQCSQNHKEVLKKKMIHWQKSASTGNAAVESDVKRLATDVTSIKSKLTKLENIKTALELSHKDMVTQYQKDVNATMSMLSQQLLDARKRNQNLKIAVQSVIHKLENMENHLNNKWRRLVAALIVTLELQKEATVFRNKLAELQQKHFNKVQDLEQKIETLNKELQGKTTEVIKLENLVKEQCFKMQEEVMDIHREVEASSKQTQVELQGQVNCLKNTVVKQQLFSRRTVQYYEQRLQELEKEMQLQVKELKLQMKTQKVMMSAAMAEEKQKEFDELISKLEERYCQLLTNAQSQAAEKNKQDQQRIDELEMQLGQLRVPRDARVSIHSV